MSGRSSGNPKAERFDAPDEVQAEALRAIRSHRIGSVGTTIHDAGVVQMERKEKKPAPIASQQSLVALQAILSERRDEDRC